jgi:hypothetical protein
MTDWDWAKLETLRNSEEMLRDQWRLHQHEFVQEQRVFLDCLTANVRGCELALVEVVTAIEAMKEARAALKGEI